jgi:hypothetical protein
MSKSTAESNNLNPINKEVDESMIVPVGVSVFSKVE